MNLFKNRVFQNAAWIIGCRIVQASLNLIIGMIMARYLGPSNYGLLNYACSIVTFVVPIANLGLRNILVEEIVSCPENEGKTIGTSILMSLLSSLFCVVGCIVFVLFVNAGERDTILVCSLYSISLIFQMTEMIQYWYQAKLMSKYTSVVSLVSYAIVSAYKIFLFITKKNIYWFALSYTFDFLLISISLFWIYRKLGQQKLSFSFSVAKKLWSKSRYFIISNMMVMLFTQTDKIMIKLMIGSVENGYYSAAVACSTMTSFIFVAIIDSMRPVIFESKKKDQKVFEKNMSLLYSIIIYSGLAQSLILTFLSQPVVNILYGEKYLNAIPLLQIITWYSAFSYMGSIRNIWMLAEGKQKYLWIINLSGAMLNVIGNLILIPYMGATGAAIASVLTQFFCNFALCVIMKPIRPTLKLIWKGMNPKLILGIIKNEKKERV